MHLANWWTEIAAIAVAEAKIHHIFNVNFTEKINNVPTLDLNLNATEEMNLRRNRNQPGRWKTLVLTDKVNNTKWGDFLRLSDGANPKFNLKSENVNKSCPKPHFRKKKSPETMVSRKIMRESRRNLVHKSEIFGLKRSDLLKWRRWSQHSQR